MFNIGEKDEYGRQKRIEHRGKYLRASRTGGLSLRAQTEAAGLTVTANSKRGMRVSTRVAKGTNVAVQNGRFRLRGRYGKGPTKLNLSKSGVSVSTRNRLGSFNWVKPNRSSAKIFGVQMRGKKAANLQLLYLLISGIVVLVKFAALVLIWTAQLLWLLLQYIGTGLWKALQAGGRLASLAGHALGDAGRAKRAGKLSARGAKTLDQSDIDTASWSTGRYRAALLYAVCVWGRGQDAGHVEELLGTPQGGGPDDQAVSGGAAADRAVPIEEIRGLAPALDGAIRTGASTELLKEIKALTVLLASRYAKRASESELTDTFFLLDEAARRSGPRGVLQDELIEAYADAAGLRFEAG